MTNASPYYATLTLAATDSDWSAIVAPINCNTWSLQADAAILLRSDKDAAGTEIPLGLGAQETAIPGALSPSGGARFPKTTNILYVKSVVGTANVYARFVL